MLFSVVIPVYNVKDYLEKCVDSVLAQDCGDYEIILVDDGSTDGVSPELCDRYALASPDRIRVIHQENQGLGGARNTGLEAARGEYLFFVDSDDRIVPHALSYLEGQIRQTHADMYLFRLFYDRDGVLTPADPLRVPTDVVLHPAQCPELLLESPSASVRVCRRSLFLEGQIRFPAGIWYEDLATTPKCLLHARSVVALPEPLYCYLLRDGSIMRNANLKRNLEILDVLGSVRAYYESNGVLEPYRDVLCYLAVDNALMAAQRVLMGDPKADYLPRFLQTVAQDYPDYRQNPLLPGLGKRKMLVLSLLERRRYGTIRFLFSTLHALRGQRTKKK